MTDEINNEKFWNLDNYKPLINKLPENCTNQEIIDIFEKIPVRLPTGLVDKILNLIIKQTNRGKRELNSIYTKQYQINLTNQLQEEQGDFKYIPYDNNIIEMRKNEIYLLLRQGSNINYYKRILIAGFDLNILYKAIDEKRNNIELFTFYSNGKEFYSFEVNELFGIYKDKLFKGNLGRDVIRKIFEEKSKTLPVRKAKYINGFYDGWYIPFDDKESDFMLICHTQEQRDVLNSVRNAYKSYSNKEKLKLCQILNKFIKITTFNPYYLTITAAWSIISLFKPYFIKYHKIFPHLGMEGDRATAKTAIMDTLINDIWGIYEEHLAGSSAKSIARVEYIVSAGVFAIYIDELEVSDRTFLIILKEMAGAMSNHIKLNPDGSIRVKTPKVASIAMSSNTGYLKEQFGDLANNSKAIILNPKNPIKRDAEWVKLAIKIKEGKFLSLVYDYTKDWTNKDLDKLVKEVERKYNIDEKIKELGDDEYVNKHYPRIRDIYTIILAGVLLFEKIFNIKLKTDNKILNILVKSRGYMLSELVNYFITYCNKAKDYFKSDIDSEGKTITKNHPRYLNHELRVNSKGWGLFGVDNLEDFKQMTKINFKSLPDCCNQVIEGLQPENKGWLFIHDTSYKGESIYCIKVSPEILEYSIWDIEEPVEELSLYTEEEMKNKEMEEDESVELEFEELEFELLEVDGIDEKDTDNSK